MKLKTKEIAQLIFLDAILLFSIALFFALPWGFKNYPLQFQWNVFFVLAADTSGADSGTGKSILFGFVIPALIVFAVFKLIMCFFVKNEKKFMMIHKITTLCSFVVSVSILFVAAKMWIYFKIARNILGKPAESKFYEENFISEKDFKIIPPEQKRNLIYIFMESMEPGFASVENSGLLRENLLPNIKNLAAENINFGDKNVMRGGINLQGTSWTVAGLFSKTSAVPYFSPFVTKDGKKQCLPALKKLGDFLYEQDYNLVFSMGSKKQFEDRDIVLEQQHFEIHDINWYKEHDILDKNYQVFWGFEDQKLYEFAKFELENLSAQNKPFVYSMLTVDTHFPDGYKCALCKENYKEKIENVFECADFQLADFIEWAKTQSWYENTTIVITGDHNYLDAPLNNFITRNSDLNKKEIAADRRFLDIIINPVPELQNVNQSRKFSSFDVMPTVLEALGNKIEGKGIYLGRSLFSEEPTLVEKYDESFVENETMTKNTVYESYK